MPDAAALASVQNEHRITLRTTIETVKQEAKDNGGSRNIALALELIEMILRGQDDRLKALEAKP